MNIQMIEVTEDQLLQAIGSLTLASGATEDDQFFIDQTRAQLLGLLHGLRNVRGAIFRENPMTIGKLLDRRFQNATDVTRVIENHFPTEGSNSGATS